MQCHRRIQSRANAALASLPSGQAASPLTPPSPSPLPSPPRAGSYSQRGADIGEGNDSVDSSKWLTATLASGGEGDADLYIADCSLQPDEVVTKYLGCSYTFGVDVVQIRLPFGLDPADGICGFVVGKHLHPTEYSLKMVLLDSEPEKVSALEHGSWSSTLLSAVSTEGEATLGNVGGQYLESFLAPTTFGSTYPVPHHDTNDKNNDGDVGSDSMGKGAGHTIAVDEESDEEYGVYSDALENNIKTGYSGGGGGAGAGVPAGSDVADVLGSIGAGLLELIVEVLAG